MSFSGPHFSIFGLNTDIYKVFQHQYGKIQTRKTQHLDNFYKVLLVIPGRLMTKNLRKVCFSFSAVFIKKTQAETQTETEKFHLADLNF